MERIQIISLTILLVVALSSAIIEFQGYNTTFDDNSYVNYAKLVLVNKFNIESSPYAYSIGVIYPVAFFYMLLGSSNPYAPILPNLLEFLGIIACIYFILLEFFRNRIAVVTTLCVIFSAFVLIYATRSLPDMLDGLLISFMFLIYAYERNTIQGNFLAGFFAGATIFVKLGGFVLLMLLIPAWLNVMAPLPPLLVLMVVITFIVLGCLKTGNLRIPALLMGIVAAIFLYQLWLPTGASVLSMAQIYSNNQVMLTQGSLQENALTFVSMLGSYNFIAQVFPLGALFLFAIIGSFLIIYYKETKLYFLLLPLWGSLAYLFLGTESLTSYIFVTVVDRYMIAFIAPMALAAGYFINKMYQETKHLSILNYGLTTLGLLLVIVIISNLPMLIYFHAHPVINYISNIGATAANSSP